MNHDCEACSGAVVETAAGPRVVCEKGCPLRLQRIRDEDAYYRAWTAWNEDPSSYPHPGPFPGAGGRTSAALTL
jgi:hypothetical protein